MSGGLATPHQARPTVPEAPPSPARKRRRKRASLARQHAKQVTGWERTTQAMRKRAGAKVVAEVRSLFAHRWAELMKMKDRPDFAARVDALQAEEQAVMHVLLKRSHALLRAERGAARALMLDNQRRQRHAAMKDELAAMARAAPQLAGAYLLGQHRRGRLARLFLFTFASRITMRGLGRFMARPRGIHPWHRNSHPDNQRN